ncbi:hypothetical protein HPB52_021192 [Rhipicephalus sanguineus]|uniref:Uncharacterized protein n=1 Tax=Rhipicephalus sanguineus TaxID=34632 RepID=A0A9D4PP10_RHISA|nr:hypothetical protein HPB52_021192 [Rhipicephalus sanguineus]
MVRATAAPHHHHVVHPVVCCTVKRAMRLLPSALLLIFVLSLILVTLVQIAVIHSHRRAIYLQRRLASTSRPSPARPQAAVVSSGQLRPVASSPDGGASGSPTAHFQAWSAVHRARGGDYSHRKPNASHNRAQAAVRARPNALQVEALLDRNAPTVDNNIKILTGLANAARIRDIFAGARARTPRPRLTSPASVREDMLGSAAQGDNDDDGVTWELVKDDVYRRAGGGVSAVTVVREDDEDNDSARRTRKFASDKAKKSSVEVVTRPLCPEVPPGLGEWGTTAAADELFLGV